MNHGTAPLPLFAGCWYAWQRLQGDGDGSSSHYYSPLYVSHVRPPDRRGSPVLLAGFNVLQLDGPQDEALVLRPLHHTPRLLVADLLDGPGAPPAVGILGPIDFTWLRRHCAHLLEHHPPALFGDDAESDVVAYLDHAFPYVRLAPALCGGYR